MADAQQQLQQTGPSRMAREVLRRLRWHPRLTPLREAGDPVLVSCHTAAIWAHAPPLGADKYELEAHTGGPNWWEPQLVIEVPCAWKLTNRPARALREQWDERQR